MINKCAWVLATAVLAASLSAAPSADADPTPTWVAASISPSTGKFQFGAGLSQDEAKQRVIAHCRSEGYPDCTYVISGQQCVAAAIMGNQIFGGLGATKDAAEQDAMQRGNAATGAVKADVDSDCVSTF